MILSSNSSFYSSLNKTSSKGRAFLSSKKRSNYSMPQSHISLSNYYLRTYPTLDSRSIPSPKRAISSHHLLIQFLLSLVWTNGRFSHYRMHLWTSHVWISKRHSLLWDYWVCFGFQGLITCRLAIIFCYQSFFLWVIS